MRRPKYHHDPAKLTLKGERAEITEAHIYSAGQKKSLSGMFFDWLRPLIHADKAANPERYGDNAAASQPAGEASK